MLLALLGFCNDLICFKLPFSCTRIGLKLLLSYLELILSCTELLELPLKFH